MLKVQPNIDQGIEFIRISELPLFQHQHFCRWVSPVRIFEIVSDEKTMPDCVEYSEYEFWFETQSSNRHNDENIHF